MLLYQVISIPMMDTVYVVYYKVSLFRRQNICNKDLERLGIATLRERPSNVTLCFVQAECYLMEINYNKFIYFY